MGKSEEISVEEFRKFFGQGKTLKEKAQMSSDAWRELMKTNKPKSGHANDIRIMLQLARIEFEREYQFHPKRKWRFDFAIVDKKIAIEYEGIFSKKSGHTTVDGFLSDVEKYNEATKLGWRVMRYTVKNYKNVIDDLNSIINSST